MTEHDLHITICNPTYNESVSLQFLDILLDETLFMTARSMSQRHVLKQ